VFQGRVSEVAPTLDPSSRTMEIRVTVNNPGNKLKAGMFAKVRIVTERKNNIVKIPESAMLSRFGEQYVFVVVEEEDAKEDAVTEDAIKEDAAKEDSEKTIHTVVRKRNVVPGIRIDQVLEILSGLEPDEEIVVRGQTLLDDGSRVNVVERSTPLSAN